MKLLTMLMMVGAALAITNKTVPLTRKMSLQCPAVCRAPLCTMVTPKAILQSIIGGWYFIQISDEEVILANPFNRRSGSLGPRWVHGHEHHCCPHRRSECSFVPYGDARPIYEEYSSLDDDEAYALLYER
jgi:hypothetical protein